MHTWYQIVTLKWYIKFFQRQRSRHTHLAAKCTKLYNKNAIQVEMHPLISYQTHKADRAILTSALTEPKNHNIMHGCCNLLAQFQNLVLGSLESGWVCIGRRQRLPEKIWKHVLTALQVLCGTSHWDGYTKKTEKFTKYIQRCAGYSVWYISYLTLCGTLRIV